MATYHCSVKVGGKGKAAGHAKYIAREDKYASKPDLVYAESGNMPGWAKAEPTLFWQMADLHERENGSTFRELELALPRELEPDQWKELVHAFVEEHIGKRHCYTLAIHCPKAAIEGGKQPHVHLMFSERILDGIERDPETFFKRVAASRPDKNGNRKPVDPAAGGCRKDNSWGSKSGPSEKLMEVRQSWADMQNDFLRKYGHKVRVTHLSLKAQGVERQPEIHLGPVDSRKASNVIDLQEYRAARKEAEELRHQVAQIDLGTSLAEALERRKKRQKAPVAPLIGVGFEKSPETPLEAPIIVLPGVMGELQKQYEARPIITLEQSRMEAEKLAKDMGYTTQTPNTERGIYIGNIIGESQHHLVQDLGRRTAAIHTKGDLARVPSVGEAFRVQYQAGKGIERLAGQTKGIGLGR